MQSKPFGENSGSAVEGPVALGVGPRGCLSHPHTPYQQGLIPMFPQPRGPLQFLPILRADAPAATLGRKLDTYARNRTLPIAFSLLLHRDCHYIFSALQKK